MKGYIAVCAVLVIQVALANRVININSFVDKKLSHVKELLLDNGAGAVALPPFKTDEIEVDEGLVLGADSVYRVKDANLIISDDDSKATVDFHTSRQYLHFVFGRILSQGQNNSQVFRVYGSDFHVTFDVFSYNNDHCKVANLNVKLETVGVVPCDSANPKFNNQISTNFFERNIIPMFNQFYAQHTHGIEKILQPIVCDPHLQLDEV